MKLLFCGDVVGRSGRDAVIKLVPKLRAERGLDFVVVNGDNAAGGFGINPAICKEFFAAGADVITGGDHIWDQKDIIPMLASEKRLLRPHNFPAKNPGKGVETYHLNSGKKVMVIHLLGQVFHKEHTSCPFAMADDLLAGVKMGANVDAIIVDFHAEATSEKCAMGQYLDGRVSLVVGSHTHIPTADARVLKKGTGYQTDAGMCGDYDSVIGFDVAAPIERFLTKVGKTKLEAAQGAGTLAGIIVETDDKSGLAKNVEAIQLQ
jgi:metallophosphoesterase (TIGR00282 family)